MLETAVELTKYFLRHLLFLRVKEKLKGKFLEFFKEGIRCVWAKNVLAAIYSENVGQPRRSLITTDR